MSKAATSRGTNGRDSDDDEAVVLVDDGGGNCRCLGKSHGNCDET